MAFAMHEINSGLLPGVEETAQAFYRSESGLTLPRYCRPTQSAPGVSSVLHGFTKSLSAPEWAQNEEGLKQFFGGCRQH